MRKTLAAAVLALFAVPAGSLVLPLLSGPASPARAADA